MVDRLAQIFNSCVDTYLKLTLFTRTCSATPLFLSEKPKHISLVNFGIPLLTHRSHFLDAVISTKEDLFHQAGAHLTILSKQQ